MPSSAPLVRAAQPYPARLSGELDPELSRWLWLVKWVLAVPHYLVLVFLWCAFLVSTLAAFIAILVTGRYPRRLFAFNVGVLRWSWRVGFYAYSALGTDRYPPFTLARTDYPADFDVDYPEHLSRGLALVKWWLLAIPHYLVLGLLVGGGATVAWQGDGDARWAMGGGLVGLLALVAAVMVAATGAYCYSMSSRYNLIGRPAVVAVRDGHARLILRRETVDDLLSLEVSGQ